MPILKVKASGPAADYEANFPRRIAGTLPGERRLIFDWHFNEGRHMPALGPHPGTNHVRAALAALFSLALSACAATTAPQPPCCYKGEVTLGHVDDVYLSLENGQRMSARQAFPGYEPQRGFITRSFPFLEARIARVTYASLLPVLPQYDANGDGRIQEPELTVLYLREAAIGLGHEVNHVGINPRTDALILPKSESGGLVLYVERNRSRMTPAAQTVFRDLVMVGQDLKLDAPQNGDKESIID